MVKPMSPRRSPRLKGLSPAPKGPGPKPQRPKRVKNAAEDSVRQATYEAELAAWSAANEEHKDAMKIRKKKTMAAWKAAHKGAAKKVAPPPAAPPAVPPAAPLAALASPSPRLLVNDKATSPPGRGSDPTSPAGGQRGDVRFPGLRRSTAQWALDVEAVALRCGAGEPLYPDGEWFEYGVCLASNP